MNLHSVFLRGLYGKKKGETTYSINALPLGGYVSIWGENGEPDDEAKHHPRAFSNRPKWAQIAVLVAGVAMNMILALCHLHRHFVWQECR
jgi:regulator of sigma E protease